MTAFDLIMSMSFEILKRGIYLGISQKSDAIRPLNQHDVPVELDWSSENRPAMFYCR